MADEHLGLKMHGWGSRRVVRLKRTQSRVGDKCSSSNRHGQVEGEEEVGKGTTSLVKVRNKAKVK